MNEDYIGLNEGQKSPYRMKEIEKRLNDIRNGEKKRHSREFELFDSNKTMYL